MNSFSVCLRTTRPSLSTLAVRTYVRKSKLCPNKKNLSSFCLSLILDSFLQWSPYSFLFLMWTLVCWLLAAFLLVVYCCPWIACSTCAWLSCRACSVQRDHGTAHSSLPFLSPTGGKVNSAIQLELNTVETIESRSEVGDSKPMHQRVIRIL